MVFRLDFRYTVAMGDDRTARWYRLTPDRCVLGLLAVEGLLLLSEWFGWFAFNRHKGYSVLVTIATVAAAMLLMFVWFLAALVFRLRFQFSIRSLLVLAVVVAIPCSWLATEMKKAREQREAVEGIWKAGGMVSYDYQLDPDGGVTPFAKPRAPAWLRRIVGDDFFGHPGLVNCYPGPPSDELLPVIGQLKGVTSVYLAGLAAASEPFKAISTLPHLTTLALGGPIDFHDLAQIPPMPEVKVLQLGEMHVTDSACALIARNSRALRSSLSTIPRRMIPRSLRTRDCRRSANCPT